MSDRPKSTRPAPDPAASRRFDPSAALRVMYALQLRPEDRATLETLCEAVLTLTREAPMIADRIRFGGILDDVGAAAAELRHLAAYLAWVSAADGDVLSRAEHRLADAAERIGGQLAALAGELEAALATNPAE